MKRKPVYSRAVLPEMSPKLMAFFQAYQDHSHKMISQCTEARLQPLEHACTVMMQLGYAPSDGLIEHHPDRDVLVVLGKPWFEVKFGFEYSPELKFNVNARWLIQPQFAPQVPASASDE